MWTSDRVLSNVLVAVIGGSGWLYRDEGGPGSPQSSRCRRLSGISRARDRREGRAPPRTRVGVAQ